MNLIIFISIFILFLSLKGSLEGGFFAGGNGRKALAWAKKNIGLLWTGFQWTSSGWNWVFGVHNWVRRRLRAAVGGSSLEMLFFLLLLLLLFFVVLGGSGSGAGRYGRWMPVDASGKHPAYEAKCIQIETKCIQIENGRHGDGGGGASLAAALAT